MDLNFYSPTKNSLAHKFLISFITFLRWADASCCTHTPACVSATGLFWLSKQVFFLKKCDFDSSCALMFSSLNLLVPTTNSPFLSWSVFAKVLHTLQNIRLHSIVKHRPLPFPTLVVFLPRRLKFPLARLLIILFESFCRLIFARFGFFPWGFNVRQIAPHFDRSESRKCFAELSYNRDPIAR